LPPAFRRIPRAPLPRLPEPEEPELLVEFRLAGRDHPGHHDRDRRRLGDALHAECRPRLRLGRAHHARRQLWMAVALHPYERRLDVLPDRLYPLVPRALLRLLQISPRAAVDPRRRDPAADDRDLLHGVWAALGPDDVLGP